MQTKELTRDALLDAAMKLSDKERFFLSQRLRESLEPPPDAEYERQLTETLNRRVREVEEGRVQLVPGDEAMARIHALANEES